MIVLSQDVVLFHLERRTCSTCCRDNLPGRDQGLNRCMALLSPFNHQCTTVLIPFKVRNRLCVKPLSRFPLFPFANRVRAALSADPQCLRALPSRAPHSSLITTISFPIALCPRFWVDFLDLHSWHAIASGNALGANDVSMSFHWIQRAL